VTVDLKHGVFAASIFTVPSGGGSPAGLIADAEDPAWSPDGTQLAFTSGRDHNGKVCGEDECSPAGEIYTAHADGTDPVRLTNNPANDHAPAWSSDGQSIAFASTRADLPAERDFVDDIYTMPAAGGCPTRLTVSSSSNTQPSWNGPSPLPLAASCLGGFRQASVPAQIDTDLSAVQSFHRFQLLYLGGEFGHVLLTAAMGSPAAVGGVAFIYDRCAERPSLCGPDIQLQETTVCAEKPLLHDNLPGRSYWRRGALVFEFADQRSDVFTGGRAIGIFAPFKLVPRIIDGLRPFGRRGNSRRIRLARASLPASYLNRIRRTSRLRRIERALRHYPQLRAAHC
jgi:hypothetical protein